MDPSHFQRQILWGYFLSLVGLSGVKVCFLPFSMPWVDGSSPFHSQTLTVPTFFYEASSLPFSCGLCSASHQVNFWVMYTDVSAIDSYPWDKASLGTSSFVIFSADPFYHSFFKNKYLPWLLLLIVCLFSVILIWAFLISFFLLSSSNSDEVACDSSIT